MTTEQLLELDAWICESVMGAKWIGESLVLSTVTTFKLHKKRLAAIGYPKPIFSPSTDPAAAMMVLERCCTKANVQILFGGNPKFFQVEKVGGRLFKQAETLPLAIALFAQALFTKP